MKPALKILRNRFQSPYSRKSQRQQTGRINQKLNPSAIDFQIQREHSFISPKNSFTRELRDSKESVNFESENKFQFLYCTGESATETEFSTLPEDTYFCRNQSVIRPHRPQVVVNNHPEKQTVLTNKEVVPGEASYTVTITTGIKQLKK